MFDCLTWLQTCEAVKTESGADSSWTRYYCLRWKRSRSLCLRGFSLPKYKDTKCKSQAVVCLNHSFALTMIRSVSPRETREKLGKPQKQQATLRWQTWGEISSVEPRFSMWDALAFCLPWLRLWGWKRWRRWPQAPYSGPIWPMGSTNHFKRSLAPSIAWHVNVQS